MRAVLYARFSTDLQRAASIADQHRALRDALPRLDLTEHAATSDAAISGTTLARPGLEAALAEIEAGRAKVLVAEALDRISRDLEHVARIAKRVNFVGGKIHTLAEGEIGALHIGLSGTMAQLYIEELARKTKRGLRGVVEEGRVAAGRAYGYRPTAERGVFEIIPEESLVVQRIFEEYASGIGSRTIAKRLNAEGIPGPRGREWKANTIVGERAALTGIVNNPIYDGRIVWNRSTWRKDPITGKRRCFELPRDQWVEINAPDLRIVPPELWRAVREAQGEFVRRGKVKRATRPLSGLLFCGVCGSRLTIIGRERYGCPAHKETGTCSNGRTLPAADAEKRVLDGLRQHLSDRALVEAYAASYVAERKKLRDAHARDTANARRELVQAEREQAQLTEQLGRAPAAALDAIMARLGTVAEKVKELRAMIPAESESADVVDLAAWSPDYLTRHLDALWSQLTADEVEAAAARRALGAMITRIVFHPEQTRGRYRLEIEGDLAAVMLLADGKVRDLLVAGVGFEPTTFRL